MSEAEPHYEPLSPDQFLRANLLLFQAIWRLSTARWPLGLTGKPVGALAVSAAEAFLLRGGSRRRAIAFITPR